MNRSVRDHLFISYAIEDAAFCDWLALKLASEGYKVWYDRIKLLGGESYPRDIDSAIKEETFRFLSVLSSSSLCKPNPLKERTLALSISRETGTDFVVPLLVEPLSASQLDWMHSDLTYIPFHSDWADGFSRLLKKLRAVNAPHDPEGTRRAVCDWFAAKAQAVERSETLWTNLLPILQLPPMLRCFDVRKRDLPREVAETWPCYWHERRAWAFVPPDVGPDVSCTEVASVRWAESEQHPGLNTCDALSFLVSRSLVAHCLRKGLQRDPRSWHQVYFPRGLLPGDKISFTTYTGKKTYVLVTGERRFRSGESVVWNRYHLALGFAPAFEAYGDPVIQLRIQLHLTNLEGRRLLPRTAFSRRKAICKCWYNHQWLSRVLAICSWLAGGRDTFDVVGGAEPMLVLGAHPLRIAASAGIDEAADAAMPEEDDSQVLDEDQTGEWYGLEGG